MASFMKVAKAAEIPAGGAKLVQVSGKEIAVFRVDDKFYAVDNNCTHMGGPLAEGELQGTTVECPWHGAQFDVTTGKALRAPAQGDVASYPARQQDDDIEVEV